MKKTLFATSLAISAAFAAPLAAQQPIVLKFSSPAPPQSYLHPDAFTPFAAAVTQASGGALRIDTFYGGTLGNFGVTYDRVLDGVADIGFSLGANSAGKLKKLDVVGLPFEAKTGVAAGRPVAHVRKRPVRRWFFRHSAAGDVYLSERCLAYENAGKDPR